MNRRDKILLAIALAIVLLFALELLFRPYALYTSLGTGLYKAGRYESAEKLFAKKAKSYDGTPLSNRAKARYKQHDYDSSAKMGEEALRCDPESSDYYYDRGNSAYQMGDTQKAIKSYEEAILRNPEDKDARENLELALRKQEAEPARSNDTDEDKEDEPGKDEDEEREHDEQQLRNILDAMDSREKRGLDAMRRKAPPKSDNWW